VLDAGPAGLFLDVQPASARAATSMTAAARGVMRSP